MCFGLLSSLRDSGIFNGLPHNHNLSQVTMISQPSTEKTQKVNVITSLESWNIILLQLTGSLQYTITMPTPEFHCTVDSLHLNYRMELFSIHVEQGNKSLQSGSSRLEGIQIQAEARKM